MDHGQFTLGDAAFGDDYMEVLDEALEGSGVAQAPGLVVVLSPHQNNFDMAVDVELWASEPPDDVADWEEAFVAGLRLDRDVLRVDSTSTNGVESPVPAGRYAVRVTGRGFVARGWPGSTTPGDVWRLQLWPVTELPAARRLRRWEPPPPPG